MLTAKSVFFLKEIKRNPIFSRVLCCLSVFSFFITLTNSANSAPSVPSKLTDNGLIYCTHATGFSFNPQTSDAGTSMNVVTEQIYNKLFEIKNNGTTLTPSLAQSYQISDDGLEILINLRKGVKFHQTPWFTPTRDFNADDVVFSFNRVLGQDTALLDFSQTGGEKSQNLQYQIFHEQAKKVHFPYFESIKLKEKIKTVESLSPYQIKISLFKPDASILYHLASQYAIIFSQEYALQLNADNNLVQLDKKPIGTGPYQVKSDQRNQFVRLQRHPNYWKKDAQIENIIIDLSTDRTGRLAKFFNGECHIAAFPDVSQLGLLRNNNQYFQTLTTSGMNLSFLAFNFQKEKMQNLALRRAISQAINRQRIIQDIYFDTAPLSNQIIPNISWASEQYSNGDPMYAYQPEQAKQFLQDKNLELTMWVMSEEQVYNPAPIKMAELIRYDLAQAGVKVNIQNVTRNFLIQELKNGTESYDMILTGWLGSTLDPDSFIRPILSCASKNEITNLANWCNPVFDEIIDHALETPEQHQRRQDYAQAEKIVASELPILPIAQVKRVLIANGKVKGISLSPFGSINFDQLSFYKKGVRR